MTDYVQMLVRGSITTLEGWLLVCPDHHTCQTELCGHQSTIFKANTHLRFSVIMTRVSKGGSPKGKYVHVPTTFTS